jgi:transposase
MVRVEWAKWGQSLDDLRRASLQASHPRTRERFQALYRIASGQFNATTCALHLGRHDETVLGWLHRYNAHGPDALTYRRSGGRSPLLTSNRRNGSLRPSRTARRSTTACPVTTGR